MGGKAPLLCSVDDTTIGTAEKLQARKGARTVYVCTVLYSSTVQYEYRQGSSNVDFFPLNPLSTVNAKRHES
jgi:hypothetical protein